MTDSQIQFRGFPKIPRLENESYTFTEKIDGTNSAIIITEYGDIFAQSRTRILDETKLGDNYGFCKWVNGNKDELLKLGEGYHFGEWWGHGINRNYGLKEKRFSLFNIWHETPPEIVHKVPVVGSDKDNAIFRLNTLGSIAAPGFMNPEGIIMQSKQHHGVRYKIIISE